MNRILVVEDDELMQELLETYLSGAGYGVRVIGDGNAAWEHIQARGDDYSLILLDRNLPGMDGLDILKNIKKVSSLQTIPVILETADSSREAIAEGIQTGAYYYLPKPLDRDLLLSVVATAVRDYENHSKVALELDKSTRSLKLLKRAVFEFRTLQDVANLAALVANTCAFPERVALGLAELMTNAIEHGNLGITYLEKSRLLSEGKWGEEIERRLKDPQYDQRVATVEIEREGTELKIVVTDQGAGFDWEKYLELSVDRALDAHGRGIAMAKQLSFTRLEYAEGGRRVVCYTH